MLPSASSRLWPVSGGEAKACDANFLTWLTFFMLYMTMPVECGCQVVPAAVPVRHWGFPEHGAWHTCPLESEQTVAMRGGPLPGDGSCGAHQCAPSSFLVKSRGQGLRAKSGLSPTRGPTPPTPHHCLLFGPSTPHLLGSCRAQPPKAQGQGRPWAAAQGRADPWAAEPRLGPEPQGAQVRGGSTPQMRFCSSAQAQPLLTSAARGRFGEGGGRKSLCPGQGLERLPGAYQEESPPAVVPVIVWPWP